MAKSPGEPQVAEFQGLYGPYHVAEKLLQKIWLRGAFDLSRAKLATGETVEVIFPGRWNLQAGPDFREARLRIGGREVVGDVEAHFRAEDWDRHGHAADPGYDQVVLHVVLFPPRPGAGRAASGQILPTLSLLDLLWHDLEEYAADDAVEALSGRDGLQLAETLLELPLEERRISLRQGAERRWQQKVRFAKLRIAKLGWEEACHHAALEALGYSANRIPMLHVAGRLPLSGWAGGAPVLSDLVAAADGRWKRQGARPANRPETRLEQYRRWAGGCPDWPARLLRLGAGLEARPAGTDLLEARQLRRALNLGKLRSRFAEEIAGGNLGGTRLDTMVTDVFLPMVAAQADPARDPVLLAHWFGWFPGDAPDAAREALRVSQIAGPELPLCCGLLQGALQLAISVREAGLNSESGQFSTGK
jgi:hypothetical protein